MNKKVKTSLLLLVVALTAVLVWTTRDVEARGKGNPHKEVVVYVTSQGLYYDSIVTADPLPPKGKFQQLFPPETNPDWYSEEYLSTEYGPGDPGHRGGRWWVDVNGNGEQDDGDHFFGCPLLGPGREDP
jgi:hypothetical protein